MNIAIIFAGGVGTRMNTKDKPKQFLMVHGKPIIVHTIEKFQNHDEIDGIIVVCVEGWIEYMQEMQYRYRLNKIGKIVPGGKTGQLSIYNGLKAAESLTENYDREELFMPKNGRSLPNRSVIIDLVRDLRSVIFPGYFGEDTAARLFPEQFTAFLLNDFYDRLKSQVEIAFLYADQDIQKEEACARAEAICDDFFEKLPEVQKKLLKDVQAGFDGDPAAKSKEEIIFSYPGLFAIYVYRLAHILYMEKVPYIPRIMTEYAHGKTGIDINPGATIGDYFFIDHGTGVVIGETTEIGKNVKLYQGVTLGALSTRQGQQLADVKRHPTIGDNVTIYSNSTVLGGETVIGENTIIGGNTFITSSIPANTKVSAKSPELVIKKPRNTVSKADVWDWEN